MLDDHRPAIPQVTDVDGPFGTHTLRAWYQAVSALNPDRVRWDLPAAGIPGHATLQRRNPRTGTALFDALMDELPAR
jgi:hypothetical protein